MEPRAIRILCADDDPDMHTLYRRFLQKRGYEVMCCDDGSQVVDAFAQHPSDLIILDLNMPGMSGMDALELMRRRLDAFSVPIIIVSAEDSEETIVDGLSSGADEFIVKPFKSSELLAKVAIALRKRKSVGSSDMGMALGSRFAGRYELLDRAGQGGFSTVYRALDTHAAEPLLIALKIFDLPAAKRNDRQFMSAFLREAYEHSKLHHPHIISLYDFGQVSGFYFMAMEYVNGETLEGYLREHETLDEYRASFVCYQMAQALLYLSEQGLVHRDIKPANIMLTPDGDIKLLDFGLAKKPNEHTVSLDDEFRGTPQFVSPEYIRDEPLTIASDVYSLGCSLYYLASGLSPMPGGSTLDILRAHLHETPIPLAQVCAELSPAFAALIDSMLEKDPYDRPDLPTILTTCRELLTHWQEKTHPGF